MFSFLIFFSCSKKWFAYSSHNDQEHSNCFKFPYTSEYLYTAQCTKNVKILQCADQSEAHVLKGCIQHFLKIFLLPQALFEKFQKALICEIALFFRFLPTIYCIMIKQLFQSFILNITKINSKSKYYIHYLSP